MANFQGSRVYFFLDEDNSRPRWVVEKEKVKSAFPSFSFYAVGDRITSVQGYVNTRSGGSYYVKVCISDSYPYEMPGIELPFTTLASNSPHMFNTGRICIMKSDQWSKNMSCAFVIAKVAKWLAKYETWKTTGQWPGKEQEH